MREKKISHLKAAGNVVFTQLLTAGLTTIFGLFFIRETQSVSILIPIGIVWLALTCLAEFFSYTWLFPLAEEMIRLRGKQPPERPEVKTFRQWFALRGWDFIAVLVLDIIVLVVLFGILTRILGMP